MMHSMVSALCDRIYLRRSIEFLTGCQVESVEHHLLVDSPSARQVAMRQGPGRLKHVSGKLLWIQQCCRCWDQAFSKQTQSDVIALHWNGTCRWWANHWPGGVWSAISKVFPRKAYINALATNIARVIVFMGLEPLQGATTMPLGESDIYGGNAQCSIEPNHVQSEGYSWMFIMMCSVLILAVLIFWGWVCKRANDAYTSFDHVYTQYAIMFSAVTIL